MKDFNFFGQDFPTSIRSYLFEKLFFVNYKKFLDKQSDWIFQTDEKNSFLAESILWVEKN